MSGGKVFGLEELVKVREGFKKQGAKVVFTNGCFDLIHGGHVYLFQTCRKMGDVLIVGVNDDDSLRKIKGPLRPIFPLTERLEILSAIQEVDYLVSFSETTPWKIIAELRPDVLVKGGDWKPDEVVGRKEVEEAGGEVRVIPYKEGQSTSHIIEKIGNISKREDK